MKFTFCGGNQYIVVIISEDRQKITLATERTRYKLQDVSDKFYGTIPNDKENAEQEKQKCLLMSEKEYVELVINNFKKLGYSLIKKE